MFNQLNREFGFRSLVKFALPSIIMMVFMSLYTIVDGVFISHFIGSNGLSAANIVYPAINIMMAVGIMLATGGSAVVAHKLGAEDEQGARESFTFLVLAAVCAGVVISLLGVSLAGPISRLLGASDLLLDHSTTYLRTLMFFVPAYMLQAMFECFFVTAGKPHLGLLLIIGAGVTNGILDFLFMGPLGMGMVGAALATGIGYLVPAVCGVSYFLLRKKGLHFTRSRPNWRMLAQSCFNGSSEMVTNLASGVITFLFNGLMMYFLGEDGVAAITIVLYAQFLLTALYLGFSIGVAPVISYNHGAENYQRLRKIFRSCMIFVAVSSALVFTLALVFSKTIVSVFALPGSVVYEIARPGFLLFAPGFLFSGINIFSSALFTAFSDGKTSAIISFARTFVFILLGLLFLPALFDVNGVWVAVPFAEVLAVLLSIAFLRRKRTRFQYA